MSRFRLSICDTSGRKKYNATPFDHNVWWSYVHENATVIFADSRPTILTLAVLLQFTSIVDSTPKY